MKFTDATILKQAGVGDDSALADVVAGRRNIVEMTETAAEAVLRPRDCGAFDHALRAAIAARVARLAEDTGLAEHYLQDAGRYAALADPSEPGTGQGLRAVMGFVDKVANRTRDVAADDIDALKAAGTSDADIVRLCELIAFLAFQIRVIGGLRLMQEAAA